MKLKYTSEKDFKEYEKEFEDEHLHLAEEIREYFDTDMAGIIVDTKNDALKIRTSFSRKIGEKDTHAYLITVTKIPFE